MEIPPHRSLALARADHRPFEFLPRLLSKRGFCSRKEAERLVAGGRVAVNGVVRRDVLWRVDPRKDTLTVDGRQVGKAPPLYLKLHKPVGVVTTMKDPEGRPTVASLIPAAFAGVMPVGRLDQDSSGLLLLTNDHQLGERVVGAAGHVAKRYSVVVDGEPSDPAFEPMRAGSVLDGERCRPAKVRILGCTNGATTLEIVLDEGKNRQIRRSLSALGLRVRTLARIAIGPLELGDLAPGAAAALSTDELRALRAAAQLEKRESLPPG
jgi:23S rRNA pseudouridine2605 synthase